MRRIVAHTDGSCRANPGPGGYGAIVRDMKKKRRKILKGAEADTTNNRMELAAVIAVLEFLSNKGPYRVQIFSDSQYVINGATKWMRGWRIRKWKSSTGQDVKNRDLWEKLDSLRGFHDIEWNWVRGHNGDKYNEIADRLANEAAVEAGYYT